MQIGFDDPVWGARNNPMLEANVGALIAAWRELPAPVIHIHHDSVASNGTLQRGAAGNGAKPQAKPLSTERVYRKQVNSAFIGTGLERELRQIGVDTLFIVGLTTNHCISSTARMAGNLGFETFVVADATATFDRAALNGALRRADDVHAAALSDLQDEFADIVETSSVFAAMSASLALVGLDAMQWETRLYSSALIIECQASHLRTEAEEHVPTSGG